ncbi:MAG: YfcC family protein, partial [Firmicutes bacterium]|nr:YfcC family protein [Bacillota bacterium]
VLAVSRGIGVFMGDKYSGMSITFIYWLKDILTGVPLWAFVIAAIAVYLLIALFLQSTSGVAGITMPIFGAIALALFSTTTVGGTAGQVLLISAFTCGVNFICGIYPEATNMAMCDMTGTSYPVYLKTMVKTLAPMLIVAAIIISVAPYIGLV